MRKELIVSMTRWHYGEFDEWFDPKEDLEIVSVDEIKEDEYDDYVEYNDGLERG